MNDPVWYRKGGRLQPLAAVVVRWHPGDAPRGVAIVRLIDTGEFVDASLHEITHRTTEGEDE